MMVCVGWSLTRRAFRFVGTVGNQAVPCAAPSVLLTRCFVLVACALSIVNSHFIEYRYAAIVHAQSD